MLALQQLPYKHVRMIQSASGWTVREDQDLLAVFRDREDAQSYVSRRVKLPWRIRD